MFLSQSKGALSKVRAENRLGGPSVRDNRFLLTSKHPRAPNWPVAAEMFGRRHRSFSRSDTPIAGDTRTLAVLKLIAPTSGGYEYDTIVQTSSGDRLRRRLAPRPHERALSMGRRHMDSVRLVGHAER